MFYCEVNLFLSLFRLVEAIRQGAVIPSPVPSLSLGASPDLLSSLSSSSSAIPPLPSQLFSVHKDPLFAHNFSQRYHLYSPPSPSLSPDTTSYSSSSSSTTISIDSLFTSSLYLTGTCPLLPEYLQRPLYTNSLKVAQWNIADGGDLHRPLYGSASNLLRGGNLYFNYNRSYSYSTIPHPPTSSSTSSPGASSLSSNWESGGSSSRYLYLQSYLTSLAQQGYLLIGLNELVSWDTVLHRSSLSSNLPAIYSKAAECGFPYSYLADKDKFNGYPLGVVSALPFQIVTESGKERGFERGFLHVVMPHRGLNLHVFVVHLNAHSSEKRLQEVETLLREELRPLLERGERLLVMGDFNSLSPVDRR